MWRKRASTHASAMIDLLEFSTKAKRGALQMKHERDVIYECYNAMRAHVPADQLSPLPELWILSLIKDIFKVTISSAPPTALFGDGAATP